MGRRTARRWAWLPLLLLLAGLGESLPNPAQKKGEEQGPATKRSVDDIQCAPIPSPFPTYSQLPDQSTLPDPFLPLHYTTTDSPGFSAAAAMAGKGEHRVQTTEEWYKCRQPEIMQMLQEYQYGYYPDHSLETVTATRSGNTVNIQVTAGGKTGKFKATMSLPTGASATKKAPVVINIGGMQNAPYLAAGIAVVGFDYTSVAADSNTKSGAFWDVYKGRDIGKGWCGCGQRQQDILGLCRSS